MEVPCKQTIATKVPSITSGAIAEEPTTEPPPKGYVQIPVESTVGNYATQLVERPDFSLLSVQLWHAGTSYGLGSSLNQSPPAEMVPASYEQVPGVSSRATPLSSPGNQLHRSHVEQ